MNIPNADLGQKLEQVFWELEIPNSTLERFVPYLDILANKDVPTWEHSVRVALLNKSIAEYTHLTHPKTMFLPGLVHDAGKATIDTATLKKTVGFDAQDMEKMKEHVLMGYRLLEGVCDFSAMVLLYHHFFGKNAYPKEEDIPEPRIPYSEGTRTLAKYCGRMTAIADFYDAAANRKNDKFSPGNPRLPTSDEAKAMLLSANQDQAFLIESLYTGGVLK
jgi:response regulator RpfG family c-di-GMP phosphodiesterase